MEGELEAQAERIPSKPSIRGLVSYARASGPSEAGQLRLERNAQTARKECQQILHFPKTECFPVTEQRDANQKTLWASFLSEAASKRLTP